LRIELWSNQPAYPPDLLPWREGSTQVDAVIEWENPPTTVFIEAKFKSELSSRTESNDGQYGYPSDQLTRNIRIGLYNAGYLHEPRLFGMPPRDFVMLLFTPHGRHELVDEYQDSGRLRTAIPHGNQFHILPESPFIGQLSYAAMIEVLQRSQRWMTRTERLLTIDLIDYLRFKFSTVFEVARSKRQVGFPASIQMQSCRTEELHDTACLILESPQSRT
jgi:hypothetical protein